MSFSLSLFPPSFFLPPSSDSKYAPPEDLCCSHPAPCWGMRRVWPHLHPSLACLYLCRSPGPSSVLVSTQFHLLVLHGKGFFDPRNEFRLSRSQMYNPDILDCGQFNPRLGRWKYERCL